MVSRKVISVTTAFLLILKVFLFMSFLNSSVIIIDGKTDGQFIIKRLPEMNDHHWNHAEMGKFLSNEGTRHLGALYSNGRKGNHAPAVPLETDNYTDYRALIIDGDEDLMKKAREMR